MSDYYHVNRGNNIAFCGAAMTVTFPLNAPPMCPKCKALMEDDIDFTEPAEPELTEHVWKLLEKHAETSGTDFRTPDPYVEILVGRLDANGDRTVTAADGDTSKSFKINEGA